MKILIVGLLSVLVYIPGQREFVEICRIPKDLALSLFASAMLFHLYHLARSTVLLPLGQAILLYLGLSGLSVVNAVSWHFVARRTLLDMMGFCFFWATINLVKVRQTPAILWGMTSVGVIVTIISVFGFDVRQPWGSVFGNRGDVAGILSFAITASTAVAAWPLTALMFHHLIQSRARSSIVGLVVGLAIVTLSRLSARRVLGVLILVLIFLTAFSAPIGRYLDPGDGRWHIYSKAIEFLPHSPLLGVGRGNFQLHSYLFANREIQEAGDYFRELHNDYLQLWLEAGPAAFLTWLYILGRVLWPIPRDWVGGCLFVGLFTMLFRAMFSFPFELGPDVAWFWITAGLYWRSYERR